MLNSHCVFHFTNANSACLLWILEILTFYNRRSFPESHIQAFLSPEQTKVNVAGGVWPEDCLCVTFLLACVSLYLTDTTFDGGNPLPTGAHEPVAGAQGCAQQRQGEATSKKCHKYHRSFKDIHCSKILDLKQNYSSVLPILRNAYTQTDRAKYK